MKKAWITLNLSIQLYFSFNYYFEYPIAMLKCLFMCNLLYKSREKVYVFIFTQTNTKTQINILSLNFILFSLI